MILNQTIQLCMPYTNQDVKDFLVNKGYDVAQKYVDIDIFDLLKTDSRCSKQIDVLCDYCGKRMHPRYVDYVKRKRNDVLIRDCCENCIKYKVADSCWVKHDGITHFAKLQSTKDKRRQTCIERYGVESVMQNQEIKDRLAKSNIKKYGYSC